MKIRRTVVSQSCDERTNERTNGRTDEAKIIGPFVLRTGTKKFHHAVFEKFEKEHKKWVFLHLYRCKKRKIKKSGSVRFFALPQGIH